MLHCKAHSRNLWNWFLLSSMIIVLLFGCGGGSSSDGSAQPAADPSAANGIWQGTFTEGGFTYGLAVLTYNGEIIGISQDAGVIYKGTYKVNRNNISGSVNAWAIGDTMFATAAITGTFSEQVSMNVSVAASNGVTSSVSLAFDELYDRPSSYSLIEGEWAIDDGIVNGSLVIDAQGLITGSDSTGCVYTGVVSLLDSNNNIYALNVDATNCGALDGHYDGLGLLQDNLQLNDTFTYCLSNNDYIALYYMTRQ